MIRCSCAETLDTLVYTLEYYHVFYDDRETSLDVIFERSLDDYLYLNDSRQDDETIDDF